MIDRRREIRSRYAAGFSAITGLEIMARTQGVNDSGDNCWLTCVILPKGASPDHLVSDLNARDIEARHLWKPMHLQPVHQARRSFITGSSERFFRRAVALPTAPGLATRRSIASSPPFWTR